MLATPEQHKDVRDIERLLRTELPLSPQSRLKIERPVTPAGRGAAVPQARRKSRYRGR